MLPTYRVDAFVTDRPFSGNPAAVVPMERWLDDDTLQGIAAENNLSETAFVHRAPLPKIPLRWFTPTVEVDLCGHATLAAAHVLIRHLGDPSDRLVFSTRAGELAVSREDELLALDFPALTARPLRPPADLAAALGRAPHETLATNDLLAVYDSEDEVRALAPDFAAVARLQQRAVIATAPGRDVDFVSRFFAPKVGVPEDPVTGSSHCTLIPYWAARLGRTSLRARQISRRGGELICEARGERVSIAGRARTTLIGRTVAF